MKRQGLEQLKARIEFSKDLEEILNRQLLPPIFSLFLKHYQIEENAYFYDLVKFKDKERWICTTIMFNNEILEGEEYYAVVDYIFGYERLIKEHGKYKNKIENWNKEGFLQIGIMLWGDVLLLGIEGERKDEIWRYGNGLINTVLSKLDNNIFDFFSRLKSSIDTETIEELKIDITKLYRNWNEDFWRVREDDEPS